MNAMDLYKLLGSYGGLSSEASEVRLECCFHHEQMPVALVERRIELYPGKEVVLLVLKHEHPNEQGGRPWK